MKNSATVALKVLAIILIGINGSANAQTDNKLINAFLLQEKEKNQWISSDIDNYNISDKYSDKTTGLTYIYTQQKHKNIIVYNAVSVFAVKENKVVYFTPGIISHLQEKINAEKPSIKPEDALDAAFRHLNKSRKTAPRIIRTESEKNIYIYEAKDISNREIKVQLVYKNTDKGINLAWDISVELIGESHWWNIRIDAVTGNFIDKNDYTLECDFGDASNFLKKQDVDFSPAPPPLINSDYNVFGLPVEAPSFGSRVLLADPADATASPYGWHDTNGANGAEYTITRGNNAYAYEDANNDNLPGYSPDGTAALHFDFPYTAGATPITNQNASLTNLFYVNNIIHDILYNIGFTEAAGNFQQNNYGRGGLGNDYVLAEGFDGSGTDNANFSTPPDGSSGRMQMYLFTGNAASCTNLNVTSTTFNGSMSVGTAAFTGIGSVTANLILAVDGTSPFNDACSAITNSVAGKVVLIDRGTCTFISKAQAAQTAGAIGVIIANNAAGAAPAMSGSPALTIPVISVSQSDGVLLKNAMVAGSVTVTINTCSGNQLDGSFDNGIVVHEFGHGVSNRLTGGPSQASCLSNAEQGGEGWSDWLALVTTIEPGDQGSNSRGMGTYAIGQPVTGAGIRRYPYSTNMSINPQTYGNLALSSEVHNIGEIWCDAIWDMTWLLIDQYGFSSSYATTSGNYVAIKLVLEGMKLQPCNPGFLDARDAILTADAILYNNEHRCLIWQAFARRGMGYNALQGSSNVVGDETEGFSLPPYCLPPTQPPVAAFTSNVSTVLCGNNVQFTDQSIQAFSWSWNFGDQTTSTLQNPLHTFTAPGTYTVKLVATNPLGSDSITHIITVTPAFTATVTANPTTICAGDTVNLNAVASGSNYRSYTVSNIPYAPLTGTGTTVTLTDDAMSTSRAIGFNFDFFGTTYSNFYICSNGFITFSSGMPASYFSSPVPAAATPNNMIALCWNDLNPSIAGSSVNFFTTGTAPNRKLVVRYTTFHFGGTAYPFTVQAILYETTNVIEIHTTTISNVAAYDPAGLTLQGIENANGTDGVAVPGRNSTLFAASNDAYRFTPYTPYIYTWQPGNLSGATQNVTPASSGSYTAYITDGTACNAPFISPSITVNTCTLTLNLSMMLEGYYSGGSTMSPVLNNAGISSNPNHADSIAVELHDVMSPETIVATANTIVNSSGLATVTFPPAFSGGTYYVVVRHRNSVATWSKNPVTLGPVTNYDFIH